MKTTEGPSRRTLIPHVDDIYAELLDEGKYVGSPSTTNRILAAAHRESSEWRNQWQARSHAVPGLEATAPIRFASGVISALAVHVPGVS